MNKSAIVAGCASVLGGLCGIFGTAHHKWICALCILAGIANIVTAWIIAKKEKEEK